MAKSMKSTKSESMMKSKGPMMKMDKTMLKMMETPDHKAMHKETPKKSSKKK